MWIHLFLFIYDQNWNFQINILNYIIIKFEKIFSSLVDQLQKSTFSEKCCHK